MKDKLEEKYWRMVIDHCTNEEIWDFIKTSIIEALVDFVRYEEKEDENAGFPNGLHTKHLKSYLTSSNQVFERMRDNYKPRKRQGLWNR